jgi:hypothetical protein
MNPDIMKVQLYRQLLYTLNEGSHCEAGSHEDLVMSNFSIGISLAYFAEVTFTDI